jgi:UDP-2-acetamido-2,6-beta-L-arabino-hexul-4-ose reductase
VTVRRIERHTDRRGEVFEPLGAAELAGQRNVHLVVTDPGHVRGNHVHRTSTEVLVIRGPARVRLREDDQTRDVDVPAATVLSFTVPPGVAHAIVGTGTEPNLLVAFRDTEHDPDDPDTERVELIAPPA